MASPSMININFKKSLQFTFLFKARGEVSLGLWIQVWGVSIFIMYSTHLGKGTFHVLLLPAQSV
jgi:hypothetical protein